MGFIPEDIIRQVLDRADIVEVVSTYVPLKPAGRNFKALSPFKHEKTPSFIVSPDKQIFHCFSTGIGGNAVSFIMKMERNSFPEAVRLLADRYGIVIPETKQKNEKSQNLSKQIRQVNMSAANAFHQNLLTSRSDVVKKARDYLKGRGINLEAVKLFQLGFALDEWDALIKVLRKKKVSLSVMESAGLVLARKGGEGYYDRFRDRVIFPIFDERGRSVAFGARTMEEDNPAKYINSPETPVYVKGRHLYGFNLSKQDAARTDQIIIVEGYMDFIMPFLSGIRNIAASLGTALTIDQIRLVRRYTHNVVMLFDADPAGEAAMNRSLDLLIDEGMNARVAILPEKEDPDSYVRFHGEDAFRKCIEQAKSVVDFKIDFLVGRYGKQTVEARSRIASEMLPTIIRFKDPIARTEAVKVLARTLSIIQSALMTEKALLNELNALAKRSGPGETAVMPREQKGSKGSLNVSPAARTLLMLMLLDRHCIRHVQQYDVEEIFSQDNVRDIVRKIFELHNRDQDVSLSVLISECDEEIGDYLSGLMAKDESIVGDRIRMCRDCIQRLQDNHSRDQRRTILSEMERAREGGDQQRLVELTEEFSRLIKGVS